jgi:hypothetical protein
MIMSFLLAVGAAAVVAKVSPASSWTVGTPIVTYWAGPALSDAAARQMAEGNFNLVWCGEQELDVAQRHGLRAQLADGLLTPASLEDPAQLEKLDALVDRVRRHPALYDYFITDEPNATNFPALGRLVSHLRERDPAHLAYINLFPTYATQDQLGTRGDTVTAYRDHVRQYVEVVKPGLISYDHYQFSVKGDKPDYFLNLAMIRRSAQEAGLPFLNIVQACTWAASMRVPEVDEMRYLVYTTLAYGAQGISYYVYSCVGHTGGIAHADGSPTALYEALKTLNHDFVSIARELQPLRSLGVYHASMLPPGAEAIPKKNAFELDPSPPWQTYRTNEPVKGVLLGCFGAVAKGRKPSPATHAIIVNLDYQDEAVVRLRGPARLDIFDPATGHWARGPGKRVELHLARGSGQLVRVHR